MPNACSGGYDGYTKNCDEYPYYATEESDTGADLKVVNASQNKSEGSKRGVFTTVCKMNDVSRGDIKRKYVVVPIPAGAPTTGWCRP